MSFSTYRLKILKKYIFFAITPVKIYLRPRPIFIRDKKLTPLQTHEFLLCVNFRTKWNIMFRDIVQLPFLKLKNLRDWYEGRADVIKPTIGKRAMKRRNSYPVS